MTASSRAIYGQWGWRCSHWWSGMFPGVSPTAKPSRYSSATRRSRFPRMRRSRRSCSHWSAGCWRRRRRGGRRSSRRNSIRGWRTMRPNHCRARPTTAAYQSPSLTRRSRNSAPWSSSRTCSGSIVFRWARGEPEKAESLSRNSRRVWRARIVSIVPRCVWYFRSSFADRVSLKADQHPENERHVLAAAGYRGCKSRFQNPFLSKRSARTVNNEVNAAVTAKPEEDQSGVSPSQQCDVEDEKAEYFQKTARSNSAPDSCNWHVSGR